MNTRQTIAFIEAVKIIAENTTPDKLIQALNRIQTKLQTDKEKTAPEAPETVRR